jgi:hypothetical protein
MKRYFWVAMAIAHLAITLTASAEQESQLTLRFDHIIRVSGPDVGSNNPIRGLPSGAVWAIRRGKGELQSDREIEVHLRGLVLPSFGNINVVPNIRALVKCQITDDAGNPGFVIMSTKDFPFSQSGSADRETQVTLPRSCIAPVIFVNHPDGR